MHPIMWIENAFKFCGKLIHFYKERISFLFYCEDGKRGAVSWLSLNAVEVKQTSHLLDVCRFRFFLWQFDGFSRIFRFPSSLIQPVLYIVHVHRHQWYMGLLDYIVCIVVQSVFPVTEPFNVWGWICPPVRGSFPRLHYTVNNVHITVGMIMEWHVSISCTPF